MVMMVDDRIMLCAADNKILNININKDGSPTTAAARQGRALQRYTDAGGRLIVGCIPYRFKGGCRLDEPIDQVIELLVISSQKGHGIMFPKGGWEIDETEKQAAAREAMEEAGVIGDVEITLGKWIYNSRRYGTAYEVIMFPLNVTEVLELWPEINLRNRRWVTVDEALKAFKECHNSWMREALDRLLLRLSSSSRKGVVAPAF